MASEPKKFMVSSLKIYATLTFKQYAIYAFTPTPGARVFRWGVSLKSHKNYLRRRSILKICEPHLKILTPSYNPRGSKAPSAFKKPPQDKTQTGFQKPKKPPQIFFFCFFTKNLCKKTRCVEP